VENHYLRDAKRLLTLAGKLCSRESEGDVLLAALTYFALGCERMLKAMLWEINPAYTLIDSDFKNSAALLYPHRLTKYLDATNPKARGDSVGFREAIIRARTFYAVISKHWSQLHRLREYRDTIAHHDLQALGDELKLKAFLLRFFAPMVEEMAMGLNVKPSEFFTSRGAQSDLMKLAAKYSLAVADTLPARFAERKEYWETAVKPSVPLVTSAELAALDARDRNHVRCPACGQPALVAVEVDYDWDPVEETGIPQGAWVTALDCTYCNLHLTDPEEIDFTDVNDQINAPIA